MVTTTNTGSNFQGSNVEFSVKASNANIVDKGVSEFYKMDNNKASEKSKKEEFKEVLNSKSNLKANNDNEKIQKIDNTTGKDDASKIEELKKELKELEDDSKSDDSKEKIEDILAQLLNLLSKLENKDGNLKLNGEMNSEALKNIIDGLNENKASNNIDSIMEKLIQLMKKDSVKDALDNDSLKSIKEILSNLSAKIVDDNSDTSKNIKSSIKDLMTELSKVLENKQNAKVLTLEDMLSQKYSQDNKEGSLGSEKGNTSDNAKAGKDDSKENKFLNSLIDDKKDDSLNKINLFAARSQVIQNQSTNTVRGLTINKATFTNDLIKDVKFMTNNAMKELTVKVNPGDLGEITIKLIQEDGLMKANLKANSKETSALLSQNLAEIKKQLTEQNIKIADVNIELYQEDTTFFSEQGFGRQLSEEQERNNRNSKDSRSYAVTGQEDSIDNIAVDNSNIEFFA